MATETPDEASRREQWVGWVDGSLATLRLGSLPIVVAGGLVQVSLGAFSMTIVEAWRAVFDPDVVLNPRA